RVSSIVALTLALALATLLLVRPEALLFHPSPTLDSTPEALALSYQRVEIETADGETLVGWYLPADARGPLSDGVILYCHGNAGNMGGRVHLLPGLRSLGLAVLMFDYRGYGESSGRPTVAGTRLDIQAVWAHLIEDRGHAPAQIVLWGRSLGGAVAIDQAARASEAGTPPRALIVESSFTSTLDIGAELYPWLPVRWLGRKLDYPSRELIARVRAPILIAHSPDDELIPASHGDALLDAARSGVASKTGFVRLDGGHNDGSLAQPRHLDAVLELLR
ncbi:MAG TPA: alpha/beta hydrolase, partial [Enhygromyxa sp.]|nr:alpha/beta hydrolase [Enhygromyxa sp.]